MVVLESISGSWDLGLLKVMLITCVTSSALFLWFLSGRGFEHLICTGLSFLYGWMLLKRGAAEHKACSLLLGQKSLDYWLHRIVLAGGTILGHF